MSDTTCPRCYGTGRYADLPGNERPCAVCDGSGKLATDAGPTHETPKRKRPCFMCNGTGNTCNICGEAEDVCKCDEDDLVACADCDGTGVASADRD